jgi:hypothetical protein
MNDEPTADDAAIVIRAVRDCFDKMTRDVVAALAPRAAPAATVTITRRRVTIVPSQYHVEEI